MKWFRNSSTSCTGQLFHQASKKWIWGAGEQGGTQRQIHYFFYCFPLLDFSRLHSKGTVMLSANSEISSISNFLLVLFAWIHLDVNPAPGSHTVSCMRAQGGCRGCRALSYSGSSGQHQHCTPMPTLPPHSQPALAPPRWAGMDRLQGGSPSKVLYFTAQRALTLLFLPFNSRRNSKLRNQISCGSWTKKDSVEKSGRTQVHPGLVKGVQISWFVVSMNKHL